MSRVALAQGTPPPLAAYLRRATWGLPPQRQQELWDELEEHVLARADQLCLGGTPPEQALSQALRELGPPTRVSAGMTQVYLMPKLILAASAAALALSAALYALAGGSAGPTTLPVLTQQPVKPSCVRGTVPQDVTVVSRQGDVTCYTSNDPLSYRGAFLSLTAVRDALQAQGVRAELRSGRSLEFRLPGGSGGTVNAFSVQGGEGYISVSQLFNVAAGGTTRVTLRGFDAPVADLGGVQLRFGNGEFPTFGRDFYGGLAPTLVGELLPPPAPGAPRSLSVSSNVTGGRLHRVQTGLPAGEVVLLITRQSPGNNYDTDTAEVGSDGSAELHSALPRLRFVSRLDQLSPYPSGGRIPALLVRVSNIPLSRLPSGIVTPPQPTSDAN